MITVEQYELQLVPEQTIKIRGLFALLGVRKIGTKLYLYATINNLSNLPKDRTFRIVENNKDTKFIIDKKHTHMDSIYLKNKMYHIFLEARKK